MKAQSCKVNKNSDVSTSSSLGHNSDTVEQSKSSQTGNYDPKDLDALGQQLVWRIGRDDLTDDVVVRVGYASATGQFAGRSRLRNLSDAELEEAMRLGEIRVEWVE